MSSTPIWNVCGSTLSRMVETLKKTFWDNVRQLMVERWGRENINRLAREAKIGLASAQRIKAGKTSVGLDIVESVGRAFRVPPFSLLLPSKDKSLLELIRDKSFLTIARAYNESDERGREILLLNAELVMTRLGAAGREKQSPHTG
jgi:hypothetical protein